MTTTSTGNGEWNAVVGAYDISDDVIINHDVTYDNHIDMTGSLTINSGKKLGEGAASKNMTVDGHVSVDGTLDLDRSSSDGNATFDSIIINSGGQVDAPSHGTITILSEDASHAFRCSGGGTFNNNDGSVTIQTPAQTRLKMNGTGNLHNLTVNHGSCQLHMESDTSTTIEGNLTITAGTVNTNTEGGASRNLTVTGELSCAGTFTGNASLVTVRNLLITAGTFTAPSDSGSGDLVITGEGNAGSGDGYAFRRTGGTFTHSSGTVTFTTATTTQIRMGTAAQSFNNVIFDESSAGGIWYVNDEGFTVTGDCTLTDGDFDTGLGTTAPLIDIQGDLTIGANNTFGGITATQTGNISFGSVTIASGGELKATSGTTTITSETSGTGRTLSNAGTFTHNKGLVKIYLASPTTTQTQNGPFWDLEQVDASTDFLAEAALTIYNNFTFVGDFDYTNNSHHIIVHGNVKIGDGSTTTRYCAQSAYTNNLTVHGTLEITNGATADLGTHGTVNLGGIRNTGGSIS